MGCAAYTCGDLATQQREAKNKPLPPSRIALLSPASGVTQKSEPRGTQDASLLQTPPRPTKQPTITLSQSSSAITNRPDPSSPQHESEASLSPKIWLKPRKMSFHTIQELSQQNQDSILNTSEFSREETDPRKDCGQSDAIEKRILDELQSRETRQHSQQKGEEHTEDEQSMPFFSFFLPRSPIAKQLFS